jgi:hypothetical protein
VDTTLAAETPPEKPMTAEEMGQRGVLLRVGTTAKG